MKLRLGALALFLSPFAASPALAVCVPIEQWTWDGTVEDPNYPGVCNSPIAVQLTDDNGDSVINELDDVDVVFTHESISLQESFLTAVGRVPASGEVERVLDRGLVEKIYLATLSRRPLPAEMDIALSALNKDRKQGIENLQWALLNKPEVLFNY